MTATTIHATAIAVHGFAVVLLGKSGAGKSDLALRLIDRGAQLISDDRVEMVDDQGQLWATAVPTIAGKLEIRGVGITDLPYLEKAPIRLVADLDRSPERLPDPWPVRAINRFAVPEIHLNPHAASATIKIEYALKWLLDHDIQPVRQANMKD